MSARGLRPKDEERKAIILRGTISSVAWQAWLVDLKSALAQARVLGHVFHNELYILAEPLPEPDGSENIRSLIKRRAEWSNKEYIAKGIITRRIDLGKLPVSHQTLTAHQLYQAIEQAHKPSLITTYSEAWSNLLNTKFINADQYCNEFEKNLQTLQQSAGNMSSPLTEGSYEHYMTSEDVYMLPRGVVKELFVEGTRHVDWLDTWRQTSTIASGETQKYVPLEKMMSSIRATVKGRSNGRSMPAYAPARAPSRGTAGPEDICEQCSRHVHTNAQCFIQHPELRFRPGKNGTKKNKAGGAGQSGRWRVLGSIEDSSFGDYSDTS